MVRLVMVMVVAVTAVITLASPQAFNDARGGRPGPLVFVACYALTGLRRLRIWSAEHWADRYSLIITLAGHRSPPGHLHSLALVSTARWQRILRPSPPARLAAASVAAVQTGLTAFVIVSECWRPA